MSVNNKRVTQLVQLTSTEVSNDDLFLIVDTSARESKKITATDLSNFLNLSGSITAISAIQAETASYVLGNNVKGLVNSSSISLSSSISITSSYSNKSSNSDTSSYAYTASWALNFNGSTGTTLITASSYDITSSWANNSIQSNTASYLLYTPGINNGTASHVITSSYSERSSVADVAYTYISYTEFAATSSWSDNSTWADNAGSSISTSYLTYTPGIDNGTASYALQSAASDNRGMGNYGIKQSDTQTIHSAFIDLVRVEDTSTEAKQTSIQAIGNVTLLYTASLENTGSIELIVFDRYTGATESIDTSEISFNITPILNQWNSLLTGSTKIGFDLAGQTSLYGEYLVEVTSSENIIIDDRRKVRFLVSSYSDTVQVSEYEDMEFYLNPTASTDNAANITFSYDNQLWYGNLNQLLETGSSNITALDINGNGLLEEDIFQEIKYTWKLTSLTDFSCSNTYINDLQYRFSDSVKHIYFNNNNFDRLPNLSNTSLIRLECKNSYLSSIPVLPTSSIYIDLSNNIIDNISSIPEYTEVFIVDNNNISTIYSLPNTILTASFQNNLLTEIPLFPDGLRKLNVSYNSNLNLINGETMSISMSYLDVSNCSLSILPTMSISMSYLDISNNLFSEDQIVFITDTLISNGISTGSLISIGYGAPPAAIYNNLYSLAGGNTAFSWSISYDGFPI